MPTGLPPAARDAVLAWYDATGRSIPFRSTRDPYAILVSEVMAQQTQIARVVVAWQAFLDRFPSVTALGDASPADVLRQWQGMGYDRRALNLRRAAIAIRDHHAGRVPDDLGALLALPGVGPYTARAVLAIAFGRPVAAVDTNVRRVIARSLGLDSRSPAVQAAADGSIPRDRPGDWTHALMDVGATRCRPGRPLCAECPLRPWCRFEPHVAPRDRPRGAQVPAGAGRATSFEQTTRWLRGRILDRLRSAQGASWTTVHAPIGVHDERAVASALAALASDGLVEVDASRPGRARLPLA